MKGLPGHRLGPGVFQVLGDTVDPAFLPGTIEVEEEKLGCLRGNRARVGGGERGIDLDLKRSGVGRDWAEVDLESERLGGILVEHQYGDVIGVGAGDGFYGILIVTTR